MDNLGYLFAVYTIVWAVIFGYVLVLIRGQKKLRREIEQLKEAIKEKGLK
ncbi:MAG: CcmD family protein [Chloroflexota bacterium]